MKKNLFISAAILLVSIAVFFTLIKPRLFAKTPVSIKPSFQKNTKDVKEKKVNSNIFKVSTEGMSADEMAVVLDTTDLSGVLSSQKEGYTRIFDGFYGKDNYRIEFFIEKVLKDSSDASLYWVSGKTKYKNNIEPFAGEIRLNGMKKAIYTSKYEGDSSIEQYYSATGAFKFTEQGSSKGTFAGQMFIDFQGYIADDSKEHLIQLFQYTNLSEAKAAGFIMKGSWTNASGTQQKPLLLAGDLLAIANDILPEFSIGERDVEINPKYRHLGWDEYWSNKEWWNESTLQ